MSDLTPVWRAKDGTEFETKTEADIHNRKPLIVKALNSITKNDKELTKTIFDNMSTINSIIKKPRNKAVTDTTRSKLRTALDTVTKIYDTTEDKDLAFLVEEKDTIVASFRYAARTDRTQLLSNMRTQLLLNYEDNTLADFIIENRDAILEAFNAGVPKKEMNPKALEKLQEYRAKKAAKAAGTPIKDEEEENEEEEDDDEFLDEEEVEEEEEVEVPAPKPRARGARTRR